ncbi:uncharacterized protein [Aegilops tauschii subsp. strangulata]|uniref:uncharacterized protein n=1 Tax=Aegilops tauschii subsp. strangulata TaxID=200361 RepID=UPI001ABC8428|nr:uncharacterized protein LOC109748234 [Aegilops tauschii subsp. strangulata]
MARCTWALSDEEIVDKMRENGQTSAKHWLFDLYDTLNHGKFTKMAVTLWAICTPINCRARHATSTLPRALSPATLPLWPLPRPRHHCATMPPRRRGSSGYHDVRERPGGTYYAEIRSSDVRLGLATFRTAHEAARAYDTAAWRLERPPAQMNFHDVFTREQAQNVAPLPRLITDQDHAKHRRRQRRLLVAKEDERAMAEWRRRHPEDVAAENAFWAERTAKRLAERLERRRQKALAISQCDIVEAGGVSKFRDNDPRWDDMWIDTSDNTSPDEDEDDLEYGVVAPRFI